MIFQRTQTLIKIRKIKKWEHNSFKYIIINFYLLNNNNIVGELNIVQIKRKIYIINYL